ncbi:MAG: NAD(P)/FAD-dependent oxidoreductase [Methanoregula sp.]|nr:MAG: NAD(P)/FAD-dependent oxidoreductase [Methanoregula sp.]
MKICIIGGGLTGLVAAGRLSGEHEINLFEKKIHLGGCLSSYQVDNYWIEQFYHHCFSGDIAFFKLLKELKLFDRLEWLGATSGYYAGNAAFPLNTPVEILKYPYLSLIDKAKLAWLTMRAKRIDVSTLDSIPAEKYVIDTLGKNIYSSFFEPLLNSKFGENRRNVSAAWLMSRIAIRSNRGLSGERLGYLNGGFHQLIDALEGSIQKNGGHILRTSPVLTIHRTNDAWEVNGSRYDAVISTIPPQELAKIGGVKVTPVQYQGAACMTIGLGRDVTDGIYWLNMKDPAPYGAVVSHTNFVPRERYGEHIVYLASYFSGMPPQNIDKQMLADFCHRFHVKKEEVHWTRMAVDRFAGPVYTLGYRSLIPEYGKDGFFMAGMFSLPNYPERSMEGAVRAGNEVADRIMKVTSNG